MSSSTRIVECSWTIPLAAHVEWLTPQRHGRVSDVSDPTGGSGGKSDRWYPLRVSHLAMTVFRLTDQHGSEGAGGTFTIPFALGGGDVRNFSTKSRVSHFESPSWGTSAHISAAVRLYNQKGAILVERLESLKAQSCSE